MFFHEWYPYMHMLTRKLCLMKVGDRFGAAWTTNSDFFLSAIVFNFILKGQDIKQVCETKKLHTFFITIKSLHHPFSIPRIKLCIRRSHCEATTLPGSFAALPGVHCRSSFQIWEVHPGPISFFVNGPRGSQTFCPVVGRLCWTRNEDCCKITRHTLYIAS